MKKFFTAALLAATTLSSAAVAAIVPFSTPLVVAAGSLGGVNVGGTGSLSFSYDDRLLSGGTGVEFPVSGLTNFTLTFGSATFSATDDANYPTSPIVTFASNTVSLVSATFAQGSFAYQGGTNPTFSFVDPNNAVIVSGTTTASTTVPGSFVPEPATLAIIGVALAGLAVTRRRA